MKIKIRYRQSGYAWVIGMVCIGLFMACSDDKEDVNKGAVTPLVQQIVRNVPYITQVTQETVIPVTDGVQYTEVTMTYVNQTTHMFVAEIDLNKNIEIMASSPNNVAAGGKTQSMPVQAERAESTGETVYLAINGDFFTNSQAQGVFYKDEVGIKKTASNLNSGVLSVMKNGSVKINSTSEFLIQSYVDNVSDAVSGGERLIEYGNESAYTANDNTMNFYARTFAGISEDGKKLFFFVIDKGNDYSYGMRISDVILICKGAGCFQAFNLSGGNTSTMIARNEMSGAVTFDVVNKPATTNNLPVNVVNGIMVVKKK